MTEVTKKSSKQRKHVEEDSHESHEHHHHHDEHCDCGCDHNHNEHEHLEHYHHHDDHCDCGCCDDDDDDDESIAAAANREGNGQATVFIVEKLGCAHCAGKMEEQISHLPGVEAVNLTFATKQLRVWSDDAKTLLPQIQEFVLPSNQMSKSLSVKILSVHKKKRKKPKRILKITENSGNLVLVSFYLLPEKHWNLPSLYTVWYVLSLHI